MHQKLQKTERTIRDGDDFAFPRSPEQAGLAEEEVVASIGRDEERETAPREQELFEASDESVPEETRLINDDTLSLYLKEMGSVPLLRREEELELTRKLDRLRRRYRHAVLCSWKVLSQVADTFERIQAGQLPLDRTIDVVPGLGLTVPAVQK